MAIAKNKTKTKYYGGYNMDMQKKVRLNELAANFNKAEARKQLVKEFGSSTASFSGTNANGEDITISISNDGITLTTYQNNGHVQVTTYDSEGQHDSVKYDGKWK